MNSILYASYDDALELYKGKKYKESLNLIASELDIDKDMLPDSQNYELRYLAAHNHWKLGNKQAAITHLKRCIDIQRNNINPLIDLSILFTEIKRYGDANYITKKALQIEEHPIVYFLLGKIALYYRNYKRSKEYFEKSISLDPELSISYNSLGIVLMRMKKYSQANTAFSAALAITPDSFEILNNIALSLQKTGKYKEAIQYIKKAIIINPNNLIIKSNLKKMTINIGMKMEDEKKE